MDEVDHLGVDLMGDYVMALIREKGNTLTTYR